MRLAPAPRASRHLAPSTHRTVHQGRGFKRSRDPPALADKWRQLGADAVVLPNGCLVPELARSPTISSAVPEDRPPTVGLVGHLSARIDMSILEAIAACGFTLLIAGPCDERWERARFSRLVERSETWNASASLRPSDIPALLGRVDVGITPYTDSEFRPGIVPAEDAGIPRSRPSRRVDGPTSVSMDCQDMHERMQGARSRNHLSIASMQEDFVSEVGRLASGKEARFEAERRQYAAQHSWQSRWAALMALVELRGHRANSPMKILVFPHAMELGGSTTRTRSNSLPQSVTEGMRWQSSAATAS